MKVRRVDLYAADWLEGTAELSDVEFGIYTRACMLIYARGGPIKIELLRRVCTSHGKTFNFVLNRLETLSKWERNGSEIDVKRCRNELERSSIRSQKFAENLSKYNKTNGVEPPLVARAQVPSSSINHQSSTNSYRARASREGRDSKNGFEKIKQPPLDHVPGHFDGCRCPACERLAELAGAYRQTEVAEDTPDPGKVPDQPEATPDRP